MGLENRDYYRDGSYTDALAGWGLGTITPVVKYLILANVAVFLLQIFVTRSAAPYPDDDEVARVGQQQDEVTKDSSPDAKGDEGGEARRRRETERLLYERPGGRVSVVQEWFQLDPEKTFAQGQLWRLVTCAFCHARESIWHIVMNMVLLYWFGTRLESMYGSREFLLFYLAAAVSSSLAYLALAAYTGSTVPAIGASGAVMGVMMLYTIFYPFERFLLFWFLSVPLWALLSLYVLIDLHPVLLALSGDTLYTGVAHAGHLGGLAFGYVYWRFGLRLEAPFERAEPARRTERRPRPAPEPAAPRRDSLEDQVDEVLRKISEHGRESLTAEEVAVLNRASERYRGRK